MRTFKAMFYNQIIMLRCSYRRPLAFFILYLVSLLIYLLWGGGSTSTYSIISFILCIYGASVVGCSSVDFAFEKREGMGAYIFSQGINKWIFILSKVAVPVILSSIAAIIPISICLYVKMYQVLNVSFILMEAYVVCCALMWSLFVLVIDLLVDNPMLASLLNTVGSLMATVGVLLFTSPYNRPVWIFFSTAAWFIAIMLCLCYVVLLYKEVKIQFLKI